MTKQDESTTNTLILRAIDRESYEIFLQTEKGIISQKYNDRTQRIPARLAELWQAHQYDPNLLKSIRVSYCPDSVTSNRLVASIANTVAWYYHLPVSVEGTASNKGYIVAN